MTLERMMAIYDGNRARLRGVHPETAQSFKVAESQLGSKLPDSMKWLLSTHGYSQACGIPSLDESVAETLVLWRGNFVPRGWMMLENRGDGGVVLMNLKTEQVIVMEFHEVEDFAVSQVAPPGASVYSSYADWVQAELNSTSPEYD